MESFLSNLPEFFLWGSAIVFWLFLSLLIIIFFISDVKENGILAFISFIVFIVLTELWGSFKIMNYVTLAYLGLYLVIGLIYGFIRTFFYGRKKLEYLTYNENPTEEEINANEKALIAKRLKYLKNNFFRWWFLFPISIINWVFSDLVFDIYDWAYSKLQKLIEIIFHYGVNSGKKNI